MSVLLAIGVGVCLFGIVALAGLLFQLVRQHGSVLLRLEAVEQHLRALEQVESPRAPAREPVGLASGSLFGDFRLPDFTGQMIGLKQLVGRRLFIHWSPQCGFCERIAGQLGEYDVNLRRRGIRLALVSWGNVEENRRFAEEHGLRCPLLLQEGSQPLEAFAGLGTPVAYLVGGDGRTEGSPAIGADAVLELAGELATARTLGVGRSASESRIERSGLRAGTPAPQFVLPDLEGADVSLDDFRGGELLLVFSDPHCGPCDALAPKLARVHDQHRDLFALLMVSRGSPQENRAKVDEHGIEFPVVLQPGWRVSKQYGIFETPVAFRIDEAGVIAAEVARGEAQILALAGAIARRGEVMQTALTHT